MIERVEVLRGGGSALFGSSAIGGTINIITRDPLRNSGEFSHTLSAIGCSSSYDNNTTLNASLVTDNRKAGLYLYGQARHRSGYDHDGDGFTELPQLESQSVGLRSFLRTGTYSRLTPSTTTSTNTGAGGDLLDLPPHEALVAEQTDHGIDGGSLVRLLVGRPSQPAEPLCLVPEHGTPELLRRQPGPRRLRTHARPDLRGRSAIRPRVPPPVFLPSELTLGTEYSFDDLQDESTGYGITTDQTVHIVSAYAQNEWKNEKWSLLIGCRLDKHNLIDRPIASPRANLRFNPTEQISLRLSYAGGFRAPQAFDEDLHISIVGGDRVRILLSDDLKEERSHSVSLSADMYRRFGRVETNLLIEGFHTELDDAFDLRETAVEEDGTRLLERYNSSREPASRASTSRPRLPSPAGSSCRRASPGSEAATRSRNTGATTRRSLRSGACSAPPTSTAISRPDSPPQKGSASTSRAPTRAACWFSTWPDRASCATRPSPLRSSSTSGSRSPTNSPSTGRFGYSFMPVLKPLQCLPARFRPGSRPRLGLHLRTVDAAQLDGRHQGQLLNRSGRTLLRCAPILSTKRPTPQDRPARNRVFAPIRY